MTHERFSAITGQYGRLSIAIAGDFCLDRYLEIDPARLMTMPPSVTVRAPVVHAGTQERQPMHFDFVQWSWRFSEMLSGLWHQTQLKGQPLKKTVLRMPGPSSVDIRWIRRIVPFSFPMSSVIRIPRTLTAC